MRKYNNLLYKHKLLFPSQETTSLTKSKALSQGSKSYMQIKAHLKHVEPTLVVLFGGSNQEW